MSAKHDRLMELIEANQNPQSRPKDESGPTVLPSAAWLRNLQERYGKTPPTPHPAPVERKHMSLSESLDGPQLPAGAHAKLMRAARR